MKTPPKLMPFDAAEHLRDEEAVAVFVQDAMESNNPNVIEEALRIAARARAIMHGTF